MAQFDVYENKNSDTKKLFPYLLDIQADVLNHLPTRVVVPLLVCSAISKPLPILNPIMEIGDVKVYVATPQIVGVQTKVLDKKVCSLKEKRDVIIAALDLLFTGF